MRWRVLPALAAATVVACTGSGVGGGRPEGPVVLRIAVALPNLSSRPDIGIRQLVAPLTGEPLVGVEPDGRPSARLAKSWHVTPDGRTWRFDLTPGAKFHDGTAVSADRVKASLEATLGATAERPPGLEEIVTVNAADTGVLTIHLSRPSTFLLEQLSDVAISAPGGARSGPFVPEPTDGPPTVLRGFDGYYRGVPGIDRIEIQPYPTIRTAWAAMLRGEVDFLYEVGPDAVEFVKDVSSVQVFSYLRQYAYLVGFNVRHPVLKSPEVRRALSLAVDRQAVIDVGLGGHGVPADGHISPLHWAYDPTAGGVRYEPADASELLARAGYPLPDVVPAGGAATQPSRIRFTCLVLRGYPTHERVALVVQKQLFDIGVDMELEAVSVEELQRRASAGSYDAYLMSLAGGRALSWPYRFWHSPRDGRPFFNSGYGAADAALDQIRQAQSDVEMRQAMRGFQTVTQIDPPAIFLAWERTARAVSRRFAVPAGDRDMFATLWEWRLNADRRQTADEE